MYNSQKKKGRKYEEDSVFVFVGPNYDYGTKDPIEREKRKNWMLVDSFMDDVVANYIRSRKGHGKEYFTNLVFYFVQEMYEMNLDPYDIIYGTVNKELGWIRSNKIEHDAIKDKKNIHGFIPHRTTLFRLLNDMVESKILQKKVIVEGYQRSSSNKQKANVYYRLLPPPVYEEHLQILSYEDLLPKAIRYYKAFKKYGELYLGARELLKFKDGIDDENIDQLFIDALLPWKENDEDYEDSLNLELYRLSGSI